MKIVVSTPTGNVGSLLAPILVRAGVRPTLLARDTTRVAPALREVCDVVEADQRDPEAVAAATRDADALYWVAPPTQDDDPLDGYRRTGESVAHAVRTHRIPRVVFQSSVGAEGRHGFGEIDGLGLTEELLNGTGADVTHLRNGYFFSNLLMDLDGIRAGVLTTTHPVDRPLAWVAPLDIATVAATRLLATDWHGVQTLGVHGPQDLSFAQVADILTDALGRKVAAQQVSEQDQAQALAGFGMTPAQVDAILGMTRGFDDGFEPEDPRSIATTTPTTLGAWAFENLRPAL
ncbi:NAD(P)H-binding protein [Cellulomonas xylanilytica]|uniref:NmrA family transcriptional regulator n=1 Tax=Cellulomonas xylanilytica TaxID=233583 RepID=A0A510V739_9CELL|nr:NAD(P)H-binding protein [Cellulomonas xylanilytica]GEK22616.1 NmrA family transcriptional regulator [Cellulomonas xylanilytica]